MSAVLVVRPVPCGGRVRRAIGRLRRASASRLCQGSQVRLAALLLSAVGYAALGYWPVAVFCVVMGVAEAFLVVRARRSRGGGASC